MEMIIVNQVEINFLNAEDGKTILIPIKPVCDALGIDAKSQRDSIQNHPILGSTGVLSTSVAGDGKTRNMLCLPLKYALGWLFSIDARKVKPDAYEAVITYQERVYEAIYDRFFLEPIMQKNKLVMMLEKENKILALENQRKELNAIIKSEREELDDLKKSEPSQLKLF
jgi:hypothetical protein